VDGRAIFDARKQYVSCIVHVINLAVQVLLSKGSLRASKPEEIESQSDDEDDEDNSKEIDINNEDVLVPFNIGDELKTDSENDELDSSEDNEATSESMVKKSLNKLRTGLKKIR
jgi:septal ring-binding cell division protein DamX